MTDVAAPAGRTAWARNLAAPIRGYLHAETGGAVILVLAALAAIVWANVDRASYEDVWSTHLAIVLGGHELGTDLRGWINEGLMTLFFRVVGLEAKRELDLGELRERQRLAIPVMAAIGGMAFAAGTFLLINAGGDGIDGWGAAVSTDTATEESRAGLLAVVWGAIVSAVFAVVVATRLFASDVVGYFRVGDRGGVTGFGGPAGATTDAAFPPRAPLAADGSACIRTRSNPSVAGRYVQISAALT